MRRAKLIESVESPGADESLASLRAKAFQEIIAPEFLNEIRDIVAWRRWWSQIANWTEGVAFVLQVLGVVITFASEYYKAVSFLTLLAGAIGVLVLALFRFSVAANKASAANNTVLGRLTKAVGLETLPDITEDVETGMSPVAAEPGAPPAQIPAPAQPPAPTQTTPAPAPAPESALALALAQSGPGSESHDSEKEESQSIREHDVPVAKRTEDGQPGGTTP